jgi:hypothetical protein
LQAHLAAALPHLGERLAGTEPRWDKPLTIVCPAGGHLHRQDAPDDYRVGDRLAAYPAFHRRRARHRARLGGAGGRGDLAQPAADAYLAAARRQADPAGERRRRSGAEPGRPSAPAGRGGIPAGPHRGRRAAHPAAAGGAPFNRAGVPGKPGRRLANDGSRR